MLGPIIFMLPFVWMLNDGPRIGRAVYMQSIAENKSICHDIVKFSIIRLLLKLCKKYEILKSDSFKIIQKENLLSLFPRCHEVYKASSSCVFVDIISVPNCTHFI